MDSFDETQMVAEESYGLGSSLLQESKDILNGSTMSLSHVQTLQINSSVWDEGQDVDWALAWGFGHKNQTTDCGSMTQKQYELWHMCQYWCEGILFAGVGSIGILGNLISVLILSTK